MKKKHIIRLILLLVVLCGAMGYGYYFQFFQSNKNIDIAVDKAFGWKFPLTKFPITGSNQIAYSTIRNPGETPQGFPVRLKIPIIEVDSAVEDALITPDGRMDVPAGSVNVAWFALGPSPGKVGSAVIAGHFGINNGVPFVFYNLDKLKIGDKIYVIDDKGNTILFKVRLIKSFDRNADATTVFTSDDGLAHLNLITCEGIWNKINGNYPERLVIFTDLVDAKAITQVLPKETKTIPVVATKPALPSAALTPDPIIVVKSTSNYQNLILFIKSLYKTTVDGFITSSLLIVVAFVVFKVVRKLKIKNSFKKI